MPHCTLTLSANAGVALCLGSVRVWADALHCRQVPGFSTLSAPLLEQLRTQADFAAPDLIFYTHCHADHYSRELTQAALDAWPQAVAVLPEPAFRRQVLLVGSEVRLSVRELSARFAPLPHEGAQYAGTPHYGCLLESGGFRVLIAGDCALCAPELAAFVGNTPPDLAILDFPWLTLERGRDFVRQLRPAHLFVCHLPFAADDRWGYRQAATQAADKLRSDVPDIRLGLSPFQREVF